MKYNKVISSDVMTSLDNAVKQFAVMYLSGDGICVQGNNNAYSETCEGLKNAVAHYIELQQEAYFSFFNDTIYVWEDDD